MESKKLKLLYITPTLRWDIIPMRDIYHNKRYKGKYLRIGIRYKWLFIKINYERY